MNSGHTHVVGRYSLSNRDDHDNDADDNTFDTNSSVQQIGRPVDKLFWNQTNEGVLIKDNVRFHVVASHPVSCHANGMCVCA